MRARRAVVLAGRNGFTTEVYEFTYSLRTLRHVPLLVRLRRRQAREHVQSYRRRLSDERRQYDSERRRLVRQQQSDSLRSLTAREQAENSTADGRLYTATKVSLHEQVGTRTSYSFSLEKRFARHRTALRWVLHK